MYRRFLCSLAVAMTAGILAGAGQRWWMAAAGIFTAAALNYKYRKERLQMTVRSGMLLAFFCLGLLRFESQGEQFLAAKGIPEDTPVKVEGRITKKELKEDSCAYYLNDVWIMGAGKKARPGKAVLVVEKDECPVGSRIQAQTKMRRFRRASNEGAFDEESYQHSLGVAAVLYGDRAKILEEPEFELKERLFQLKNKIRTFYKETLNEKDAGILSAMVLGDKSLMEDELKQMYTDTGISHILAVSGLHVSIIGMGVYRFLRKCRAGYLISALLGGGCVCLFCIMSGASMSSVRAGIMFLIFLGAQIAGRTYDSFSALAVAALIILWQNPHALWNVGFLFSFMAVAGAVGIGTMIGKKADKKWKELLSTAKMSLAIQLVTLPFNACFYYEIPLYSIPANLFILPLSGMLMSFGIGAAAAGAAGLPFAWLLLVPCHVILKVYQWVCIAAGHLPFSVWITGTVSPLWILMYEILLITCAWWYWRRKNRERLGELSGRWAAFLSLPAGGFSFLPPILALALCFLQPQEKQFQLAFLDVGQGDGIYISTEEGKNIMIDGGSTSEDQVGKYQILPFLKSRRVRQIDVWFVSHGDQDHISGLLEILEEGYPVRNLCLAEYMPMDEAWEKLVAAAGKSGTNVHIMKTGDSLATETMRLTCIGQGSPSNDRNANSMVLYMESHTEEGTLRGLFTGDISAAEEKELLYSYDLPKPDILKAAHHGSGESSCREFLDVLEPGITIISCGEDNSYGHPHKETLERMKDCGSAVFITKDHGEILVEQEDGKVRVKGIKQPDFSD